MHAMNPSIATHRLLLVDDSREFLAALHGYVSGFPQLRVEANAESGEEAILFAQCMPLDAVVMDVRLPGIDGIEATRRIKSLAPDLKVVVLTLDASAEMRRAALGAGADYFIAKDRLYEEFPELVHRLCGAAPACDRASGRNSGRGGA